MRQLQYLLAALCYSILLSGCANHHSAIDDSRAQAVVFAALQQVGKPYRYGGQSPDNGFDCSGLVDYAYRSGANLSLPRTVRDFDTLTDAGADLDELRSGDLILFRTRQHEPDHAGIYVGDGRFVHAPTSGGYVRLDSLSDRYWQQHYCGARRPLAP